MSELIEQHGMSFESALSAVKDGLKVQRQAWKPINGIRMALSLHGSDGGNLRSLVLECQLPEEQRRITMSYNASQNDLLADDWIIVR